MKTGTNSLETFNHAKIAQKAGDISACYYMARQLAKLGQKSEMIRHRLKSKYSPARQLRSTFVSIMNAPRDLKHAIEAINILNAPTLNYDNAFELVRQLPDLNFVASSMIELREFEHAKKIIRSRKIRARSEDYYKVSLMKAEISMKTGHLDTAKVILQNLTKLEDKVVNSESMREIKASFYFQRAELFYAQELFRDALDNYRESNKIKKCQSCLVKIGIIQSQNSSVKLSKTLTNLQTKSSMRHQIFFFIRNGLYRIWPNSVYVCFAST